MYIELLSNGKAQIDGVYQLGIKDLLIVPTLL